MSDHELDTPKKVKRPAIVNSKYTMSREELIALGNFHQERIDSLEAAIKRDKGLTATNGLRNALIAESGLQIKLIEALLASS